MQKTRLTIIGEDVFDTVSRTSERFLQLSFSIDSSTSLQTPRYCLALTDLLVVFACSEQGDVLNRGLWDTDLFKTAAFCAFLPKATSLEERDGPLAWRALLRAVLTE